MIKRGFFVFGLAVVFAIAWSFIIDNRVFGFLILDGVWSTVVLNCVVFAIVSFALGCLFIVQKELKEKSKYIRRTCLLVSTIVCFFLISLIAPFFYMLVLYTG